MNPKTMVLPRLNAAADFPTTIVTASVGATTITLSATGPSTYSVDSSAIFERFEEAELWYEVALHAATLRVRFGGRP